MSKHVICHAHCPSTGGGWLGLALLAGLVVTTAAAITHYAAGIVAVLSAVGTILGIGAAAFSIGVVALFVAAIWTRRRDDAEENRIRAHLGLPPHDQAPRPVLVARPRVAVEPTPPVVRVTSTVLRPPVPVDAPSARARDAA